MIKFSNNAHSRLFFGITPTDTNLRVEDGSSFATLGIGDHQIVTLFTHDPAKGEIVKITARDGHDLVVVRGQEGTIARAWGVNTQVKGFVTAGGLSALASENVGGGGGTGGGENLEYGLITPVPLTLSNITFSSDYDETAETTYISMTYVHDVRTQGHIINLAVTQATHDALQAYYANYTNNPVFSNLTIVIQGLTNNPDECERLMIHVLGGNYLSSYPSWSFELLGDDEYPLAGLSSDTHDFRPSSWVWRYDHSNSRFELVQYQ